MLFFVGKNSIISNRQSAINKHQSANRDQAACCLPCTMPMQTLGPLRNEQKNNRFFNSQLLPVVTPPFPVARSSVVIFPIPVVRFPTVAVPPIPVVHSTHSVVSRLIRFVSIIVFRAADALNFVIESAGLLHP